MAIEIKGLNYIYSPGTPFERAALKNINLYIADGEYVGLIGHTAAANPPLFSISTGF